MKFKTVYLNEVGNVKGFDYSEALVRLQSILKTKYGRIIDDITPEMIFQFENQGNKVLTLQGWGQEVYVVLPYNPDTIKGIIAEIKLLGFNIS